MLLLLKAFVVEEEICVYEHLEIDADRAESGIFGNLQNGVGTVCLIANRLDFSESSCSCLLETLSISSPESLQQTDCAALQEEMAGRGATLEDIQNTLKDIKKNMSWLYDIINKNMEEKESSRTMDWMVRQIENRIEDNRRDLYEVMSNIGYMKDDLKKLVNMNQGSYIQDNQNNNQGMEEASVEQPAKEQKGKQKEQV